MTPEQVISKMEGMVSFQLGIPGGSIASQGNQVVADWVRSLKTILKDPSKRYLTDFEFELMPDVDETGVETAIGTATHLCAILCEAVASTSADAGAWVVCVDASGNTFDGTAALPNTVVAAVVLNTPTTTGVSEFTPVIFMAGESGVAAAAYSTSGIELATDLTISADGVDGANPATDAIRVWVLYRI